MRCPCRVAERVRRWGSCESCDVYFIVNFDFSNSQYFYLTKSNSVLFFRVIFFVDKPFFR